VRNFLLVESAGCLIAGTRRNSVGPHTRPDSGGLADASFWGKIARELCDRRMNSRPVRQPAAAKRASRIAPAERSSAPAAKGRARIMIVDDHPMTRAGLAHLISLQADMEPFCEAGSPQQAVAELQKAMPDLVLSDITMPGRSGLEFIKDLQAIHPEVPILVVSMHDEKLYAERALRAGARGYIMKEAGGENLLAAIRRVLSGRVYVSDALSASILENMSGSLPRGSSSPIQKLSDREFEVFQLIGQGKSTREIARQLSLSQKTIDVHRSHIKEKLELRNATSLVRYAVRWVETQSENAR
jgi:DNA-binding NarL/FixJ family response regulator